jgi:DNA repair protein RecO (recombination protein O)
MRRTASAGIIAPMAALKDDAVVLRRLDYSETSQVLALFTRSHGKARVIAKGIKRSTKTRFAPALDLLDMGTVVISVRHPRQEALGILTEWRQTAPAGALRERLDRLYSAQYAAALTSELTEDWDPHPYLFDALARVLEALSGAEQTLDLLLRFQLVLLAEVGSIPIFDHCIGCGMADPPSEGLHFSALEGGLICRDCEPAHLEKRGVPKRARDWLVRGDGEPGGLRSAFELLDYHLAHLMGKRHPLSKMVLTVC